MSGQRKLMTDASSLMKEFSNTLESVSFTIVEWCSSFEIEKGDKRSFLDELEKLNVIISERIEVLTLLQQISEIRNAACALVDNDNDIELIVTSLEKLLGARFQRSKTSHTRFDQLLHLIEVCDSFLDNPNSLKQPTSTKEPEPSSSTINTTTITTIANTTPTENSTMDDYLVQSVEEKNSDLKEINDLSTMNQYQWICSGTRKNARFYYCSERSSIDCQARKRSNLDESRNISNHHFSGFHNHLPVRTPQGKSLVIGKRSGPIDPKAVQYITPLLQNGARVQTVYEKLPPQFAHVTRKSIENLANRLRTSGYIYDGFIIIIVIFFIYI